MKNTFYTILAMIALCAACAHKEKPVEVPVTVNMDPTASVQRSTVIAQSVMKPAKNEKIRGIVHFTQNGDKVKIEGILEKLKPGLHGIHIHETGDCSAADFSSAGGHFNPTSSTHGSADSSERHAGDLGNIKADKKGRAKISVEVAGLSMTGESNIIGKALIIHASVDDSKSQPAGNSGGRVACGVIEANQ